MLTHCAGTVILKLSKRNKGKEPEMDETQQRTAEELAALIEFCEYAKKASWRYFSKKEQEFKEQKEQLEAINN